MPMLTAVCHTPDCENADEPITLDVPDTPEGDPGTVMCGVCGQPIDDVQPAE